ncbi:MAG TPA: NDP-sugar synthase [Acidimicrobiales bacterium]|nr:NDP-sugar synthase [Acidimicrobiales bacterium]
MRAVVLVGGEGTRLRPLTYDVPKQMLPVAGVTMIERVLGQLAAHGVDDVVLSMGYRPDAFLAAFPDGTAAGVSLHYAVEPEPLDTAGAIRFAAADAGIDQTFLVVNGDVLTDLDVTALVAFHRHRQASATIALTPVEDPSAFGVVPTDDAGRVTAFIEKPRRETAPTNLINAGTYVLEPAVLDRIPTGRKVSVERETFPQLVEQGSLFALASDAYWIDTGTPALYLRANRDLVAGLRGSPPAPGARDVGAGVWVLDRAELAGTVEGPALVGEGATVAEGAHVRSAVLGAGVRVEEGASVEGSVLLDRVVIGPGARVEGSMIGHHSSVGEGSKIMPTSVVGCGVAVEPGTVLEDARYPG